MSILHPKLAPTTDHTSQPRGGNDMSSGGFAARAQSAGDKNSNASSKAPGGSSGNSNLQKGK